MANSLQQGLYQLLADAPASSAGCYGKILEMTTLAVRAEHYQAQHAIGVACQPQTLALMTGGHHPLEHIPRWPQVASIQQGLELLPGGLIQAHFGHPWAGHQWHPARAAGSAMARRVLEQ